MLSYPTFEGFSRKIMTLTMIFKNNEVLLGMKNRGIGKGKWNGFGGKVEPNETIDDAAKREVKEECGLNVVYMEKIGVIDFEFAGSKELMEGHIYMCNHFSGDIVESDEMAPIKWFNVEELPSDKMWLDDQFWFPLVLKQIPFKAHFKYLDDDTMLDRTIILLDSQKKTRDAFVNIIIKKDNQILLHKNVDKSNYLRKHKHVKQGESIENAALRYLNDDYKINTELIQKIAVVDVEIVDKLSIEEIHIFCVDILKLETSYPHVNDYQCLDIDNITEANTWLDKTFLSTLFFMKPFKAYFLIDNNNILCSKYDI